MYRSIRLSGGGRTLLAVLAVSIVALAMYAFAAANTVPGGSAGAGSNTISGYAITNVVYNLNASNPQNIDSVTFSTDTAAGTAKIQLASGGSWYNCSATNGPTNTAWSCATTSPQVTAAGASQLTVVATQ